MRNQTNRKEPLYIQMNEPIKRGLRDIAKYNHTSISNLIEEGARMVINRESLRMREDNHDLETIRNMVGQ